MNDVSGLAEELRDILGHEVARGNVIARVDRPTGSHCPLAVVLAQMLDFAGYRVQHSLSPTVSTRQNCDAHYPLKAACICKRTRHALVGPTQ